jgi:hypothetical protein
MSRRWLCGMTTRHLFLASLLTLSASLPAQPPPAAISFAAVPYPEGFRRWTHVASAVVTAKMGETADPAEGNEVAAPHGLIHNLYANELALEGYRTGHFPEGAVLIADWFVLETTRGGLKQGPRKSVDVMVRDARYTETGGWGFENFDRDSRTQRNVGPKAVTSCFECHQHAGAEREFVFSTLLP